jgi:hypothetical protein
MIYIYITELEHKNNDADKEVHSSEEEEQEDGEKKTTEVIETKKQSILEIFRESTLDLEEKLMADTDAEEKEGEDVPSNVSKDVSLRKRMTIAKIEAQRKVVDFTWPQPFDETPAGGWKLEVREKPTGTEGDDTGLRDHIKSTGTLRVHITTWNQHAKNPPAELTPLFDGNHHLYAVSSQECEHTIAESVIYRDKSGWENKVAKTLGNAYVKLRSHTLQAIHLIIFIHRSLLPLVSDIRSASVAAGLGDTLGNKGGVAITFKVGVTSFAIVSSHFQAEVSLFGLVLIFN